MSQEALIERKISSELLYNGKIFDLYRDDVRLPDGSTAVREYVRHFGAACVVPGLDDGSVLMVRQFR